jgi:hypothetical protein
LAEIPQPRQQRDGKIHRLAEGPSGSRMIADSGGVTGRPARLLL